MRQELSSKTEQKKPSSKSKAYFGILISLVCFLWVLRSVESEEILAKLRDVDFTYLSLAILFTVCSYLLRAWRWPYFFDVNPPDFATSYRCMIIGFFMNNLLPARIGELLRAHLGGTATGQSRSRVLATIAGERLVDGLMISLLFAILFRIGATPEEMDAGKAKEIFYVANLFLFAAIFTVALIFFRGKVFSILERLGRIMPGHLSRYTLVRVRRFIEGLAPMLQPQRLLMISIGSLLIWSVELLVYYQVALAFSNPLKSGTLSLFLAAVNFSSLIPAAPGGIGVIEAFATFALEKVGVNRETALAMVATQHLIQICVVGIPGSLFFFVRMGGRMPTPPPEFEEENVDELEMAPFADVSEPRPLILEGVADALDNEIPEETAHGPAPRLSVVIPAFNESARLPKTLLSIQQYLSQRGTAYEVIVVDDGSSDDTAQVVRQFRSLDSNVRLISYSQNRGKGHAVRLGMQRARGELILFDDADGATPIAELERLELAISSGATVAIGSRAMYSRDTDVQTVWYRKFMGRVFNGLVNLIVLPGIADTQCGFKLFVKSAAHDIFSKQLADRFSFDVEILFLARKSGYKIAEVPVNWTNIPGSKVNLGRDSLAMFMDILRIRLRDFFGGYGV